MSGINNLNIRLNYQGGNAEGRMIKDKLKSLKKALLYSYQAATAILSSGKEFRCLINPDKLKADYDHKIISIPFKDICLNPDEKFPTTTEGEEIIELNSGDVFTWKETDTKWLVYLRHLEEDAYFRAEIRRCKYEIDTGNKKYWVYLRGPVETTISWNQKQGVVWNDMNRSIIINVQKNEDTLNFFHRFKKIKINNNTWEIQVIDDYSVDNIIEVNLKEYFNNKYQEEEESEIPEIKNIDNEKTGIIGDSFVYPYDIKIYTVNNISGGLWKIDDNTVAKIKKQDSSSVTIEILARRKSKVKLLYLKDSVVIAEKLIMIESV